MSYHLYQTRGFILKSSPTGEANRLLSVFTEDLGLIYVTAQAVRKSSSKLRPVLKELSFGKFVVTRGKNAWRLTDAFEIASFSPSKSPEKLRTIAGIFSLVSRFLQGEHPNEKLFATLAGAYEFLQSEELKKDELLRFEILTVIQILASLGYVGENHLLEKFLSSDFSQDMLLEFSAVSRDAVREINRAITESQL